MFAKQIVNIWGTMYSYNMPQYYYNIIEFIIVVDRNINNIYLTHLTFLHNKLNNDEIQHYKDSLI